jgi:methyl-accepting chemotaxis protein
MQRSTNNRSRQAASIEAQAPRLMGPLWLGLGAIGLQALALAALIASQANQGAAIASLLLGAMALTAVLWTARWLLAALVRPVLRAARAAAAMSAGDLTQPLDAGKAGEIHHLMRGLEEVRQRLAAVVGEIRDGTTHVAMNASQIARDNDALDQRTAVQARSVQQTLESLQQLTVAVQHNAQTATAANDLVRAASERADQGGRVMDEVVQTMGRIRRSSQDIREIIAVIDGIAFQTNILALNAAVEAARAGDQGRGFAVVATEVRALAQRCTDAARDIKALIGASVEKVDGGVRRVDETGRAMAEIVAAVREIAGLIDNIHVATGEQSDGIASVNGAIGEIDAATRENAHLVNELAPPVAAMQARSVSLMKGVAVFDLGAREHGNADEAVALVQAGCEFYRQQGRDALLGEVNRLAEGRFIDRDLYLLVIDLESCRFVAHGNNPRTLGQGPGSRDVDGKRFVQEMRDLARTQGQGWVEYKWAHPVTNEVLTKSTYVQRVGDVVIGCGIYA